MDFASIWKHVENITKAKNVKIQFVKSKIALLGIQYFANTLKILDIANLRSGVNILMRLKEIYLKKIRKQAGAELGQAQLKLGLDLTSTNLH